ncbi:hypothetical protein DB361_28210 [Klebsiella pneumoniae]|nr:hypothetical protein DB361_28210 [Klebsiella pneumoniae]
MDFNALHQQNQPLLLANVWDASSAQAAQQVGYQALGSSSAAIAAMLGYEDGEEMSFDELFYVVSRIKTVREGANKQVISSQADSLIKISRIWADFFPANTSNQPI